MAQSANPAGETGADPARDAGRDPSGVDRAAEGAGIGIVVVAAGRGLRMGGPVPKQWQSLGGDGVAHRSVRALRGALPLAEIVVVLPQDQMHRASGFPGCIAVAGGASRPESVRAGLSALDPQRTDRVLIHDAARPLVPAGMVRRVAAALDLHPAAAPGLELADALWQVTGTQITATRPRAGLWRAQTPQGFHLGPILAAHEAHRGEPLDDVEVALGAGIPVHLVLGDERALKLTVPADLARAEALLAAEGQAGSDPEGAEAAARAGTDPAKAGRGTPASADVPAENAAGTMQGKAKPMDIRVGQGFDVHAFGPGDHVVLCGIRIPHPRGLAGHSDADVGLHALCDAIYGALSEGDIGRHFPPSEAAWKGKDSMHFLEHAAALATARGYRINQADVTLICERPKIGPHAAEMMARIAPALGIAVDRVSVKATTSERLGFTGREEGIAAMAVVTLIAP